MGDRIFAETSHWALASDGTQWILLRHRMDRGEPSWRAVAFVRSTRDVLARCMREKGVGAAASEFLLTELPDTFDTWKTRHAASQGDCWAS